MKRTLSLVLILCAFLCACTGKTEFSESFICGEAEAYAVCEEGLLTASAGSVKCFDGAGEQTLDRELEVKPACIVKKGPIAAAYARGGTSIVFPDSGVIETDNGIRDVQLSAGGYLAVCTQQPGYMGSVTVYSPERERMYKWYCASQRLVSAVVSPDGKYLAVLTDEGIRLFSLDSEKERASFSAQELRAITWLGDRVCGIGNSAVYVCNDKGKSAGKLEFDGKTLGKFGVLDKKLIIEVREHASGGSGEVYILDDDLKVKDRISVDGEVWSLDCRNGKTAVLTQNGVSVYDGAKLLACRKAQGAEEALLTDSGEIIAVGGGSAWVTEK